MYFLNNVLNFFLIKYLESYFIYNLASFFLLECICVLTVIYIYICVQICVNEQEMCILIFSKYFINVSRFISNLIKSIIFYFLKCIEK